MPTGAGGPLPHVMAAKAVALTEASQPSFRQYAASIVDNARSSPKGWWPVVSPAVTGGNGQPPQAHRRPSVRTQRTPSRVRKLRVGITLNRNVIPDETNGPWYTSGLRLGTLAATTLGMRADEMEIKQVLAAVLHGAPAGVVASGPTREIHRWCSSASMTRSCTPHAREWTTSSFDTRSTPRSSSDRLARAAPAHHHREVRLFGRSVQP